LEGIGFEGVIMGAREIGERFGEIEDSVNRIAQEAGLASRTIEEASASLTEMGIAVEEINIAVKDLMGDVSYIKRTAEDIRGVVESLKEMFSLKSGEYGGGRWIIWAYEAFLFSFSAILILGGYILWKNGIILPSLLLYAGGIENLIAVYLLCLTSENYIFSVLENKPRFEVASLYVPMEIVREYINREFYEKPKGEMEVLILSLNSLLDKVRETFVSIKEINLQISQISTAVRQISKSFEEVLKPSMDELKALSEQALKSSQRGYQITLENIGDFEKKVEELGRIISDLERVSEIAKNLSENVESLSRIIEKINLVSINATVEAYKMGEGGPFEVVSREIRGLSEKSNLIIEGINKGMEEIRGKIESIMKERAWWEGNLEGIRERARGIVDVFGEISARIEKSDEMVRAIAQALYESASAVKETYISLENIDRMVSRMSENLGQISERTSRILDEVKKAYEKV
jgi:methyl-accepting chemotaxis protein